ncbi:hypothetical protein BDZ45DRAFT_668160, partial [Acephala macrosclerotiorum]
MTFDTDVQTVGDGQVKAAVLSAQAQEFTPGHNAAPEHLKDDFPTFQEWLIERGASDLFDDVPIEEVGKLFQPMIGPVASGKTGSVDEYHARDQCSPPYDERKAVLVKNIRSYEYTYTHAKLRRRADFSRIVFREALGRELSNEEVVGVL